MFEAYIHRMSKNCQWLESLCKQSCSVLNNSHRALSSTASNGCSAHISGSHYYLLACSYLYPVLPRKEPRVVNNLHKYKNTTNTQAQIIILESQICIRIQLYNNYPIIFMSTFLSGSQVHTRGILEKVMAN